MLSRIQQQCGQQSSASGHGVDYDVFVLGVSAVPYGAEAVESWGADGGGEISVRAATGCAFSE
jgi:hypothetical protein